MKYENIKIILLLAIIVMTLFISFALFLPFIHPILWGCLLAIFANPIYKRILKISNSPSLSALISCLIVIFLVIIPMVFVISRAIDDGISFSQKLHVQLEKNHLFDNNKSASGQITDLLKNYVILTNKDFESFLVNKTEQAFGYLINRGLYLIENIIKITIQTFIAFLTFFFLLKDSSKLMSAAKALIPLDDKQATELIRNTVDTAHLTVNLAFIIGIVQGTLGGIAFFILGLPSPLFWWLVMVILSMVPFVGTPFVWLPAALILIFKGMYIKGIMLILWGVVVIGLVDNLIRSFVIGEHIKLHPLITFFSVFGGVLLMGPLGLFLGPVILHLTFALIKILKLNFESSKV